jgi:hypothetical protein
MKQPKNEPQTKEQNQAGQDSKPTALRFIGLILPVGEVSEEELLAAIKEALACEPSPEEKKIHDTLTALFEFVGEITELDDILGPLTETEKIAIVDILEESVSSCGKEDCRKCKWTKKLIKIIKDKYKI